MNRFPDHARVCFVGDSITHNNIYLSHIVAYYRENFPDSRVEFYNCGTSGGHMGTILSVFEQDTMQYNPTHIVLLSGPNDAKTSNFKRFSGVERYDALHTAYEEYQQRIDTFCEKVKTLGIELTLCTPLPYAEYQCSPERLLPGGYALLQGYAAFIRSYAKEKGYSLCDYHSNISRIMQMEDIYAPDGFHLKARGQYYMAKCFLASQGLELGEERDIPAELDRWRETVAAVRANYAAVHNILGDAWFEKTVEEQTQALKEFLAQDHEALGTAEFRLRYANAFVNGKKDETENVAWLKAFMKPSK